MPIKFIFIIYTYAAGDALKLLIFEAKADRSADLFSGYICSEKINNFRASPFTKITHA